MIEIKTAGHDEVSENIRLLVASSQGDLATRFALTAPNTLVASVGGSLIPLAESGAKYAAVKSETDLFNLKVALTGTAEERTARFGFQVDTLVIDTLDEFQRRILVERLRSQKRIDTNYEDWNWISQRLNAIYAGLNELDINVITITHLANIDETSAVKPNIQGAFGTQIHNYVDYAFYLRTGETVILASEVEAVSETDNLVTFSSETSVSDAFLVTQASDKAEWVHDNTRTLPAVIDLTFVNDFDIIVNARQNLKLQESSSFIIIEDEVAEEVVEIEKETATVKEVEVTGMSSATDVKTLLANRRNKINNTEVKV